MHIDVIGPITQVTPFSIAEHVAPRDWHPDRLLRRRQPFAHVFTLSDVSLAIAVCNIPDRSDLAICSLALTSQVPASLNRELCKNLFRYQNAKFNFVVYLGIC